MAKKLFRAVGFLVDIGEIQHPDDRAPVFHIPSRPRGTAYHFGGVYLMRVRQAPRPINEDHLR